jgi:hypothetical protein
MMSLTPREVKSSFKNLAPREDFFNEGSGRETRHLIGSPENVPQDRRGGSGGPLELNPW